jgi:restriction endonuclease S subunit
MKIPLPSLDKQKEIVDAYQDRVDLAISQEREAIKKVDEIEKYLYAELGIEITSNQNKSLLSFFHYKELNYWSLEKITQNMIIKSNKYLLSSIQSVCSIITDGTHQTPKYTDKGIKFLSARNVTNEIIDWEKIKYVSQESHNNYCKRVHPSYGDILLAKNGTTGVGALVECDEVFSIYVSLALLRPIENLVNKKYLLILINSSILRKQFFSKLVGVGVPNLHLREIREVKLPLPPLDIQTKIATHILKIKDEIEELKNKAKQNRVLALKEFEHKIFLNIN